MADFSIRPVSQAASEPTAIAPRVGELRKKPDAAESFEAYVLQTFIQEMMPDQSSGVFGDGIAGDFWKSMMSEKIAAEVASRGGVGIAETVRNGHEAPVRPSAMPPVGISASVSSWEAVSSINRPDSGA